MPPNLLILGGTLEASALARAVAKMGMAATLSYAGRVERLKEQPIPRRVGGFGGVCGLAQYLRDHKITHVVDATHPFAAQMSKNAGGGLSTNRNPVVGFDAAAVAQGCRG